jgi:hypothetical protein
VDVRDVLRNVLRIGSAGRMARLLLVVAGLTGFLLMHGLAATDSAGAHHVGDASTGRAAAMTSQPDHLGIAPMAANAGDHDPASHDAAMAGCVFILLALAGGIVLRALRTSTVSGTAPRSIRRARHDGPARAPPCPVFLSLCVFRL